MKNSNSCGAKKAAKVVGAAEAVLGTDVKGQNSMYDTRSGTLLTVFLLFVIGWIPTVGQMVAGFVGGRRAGSPMRGFVASLVGTIAVLAVLFCVLLGLNAIDTALVSDPESKIAALTSSSPLLAQLLNTVLSYVRGMFGNADLTINFAMYAITIPFGIIGGLLSNQHQKEARLIVDRTARINEHNARSVNAYRTGRPLGFESYDRYVKLGINTTAVPTVNEIVPKAKAAFSVKKEEPVASTMRSVPVEATATATSSGSVSGTNSVRESVSERETGDMDYI